MKIKYLCVEKLAELYENHTSNISFNDYISMAFSKIENGKLIFFIIIVACGFVLLPSENNSPGAMGNYTCKILI